MFFSLRGYDVFIGKSRYVETKLLDQHLFRDAVEERLADMLEHPNAPHYLQRSSVHGDLTSFRRARILDTHRLYIRIHEHEKSVVIVAFVGRADIKRDEKSGALDHHFIQMLLRHEILGYAPIERLQVLEAKAAYHEKLFHYQSKKPRYRVSTLDLSEDAALGMLHHEPRHKIFGTPLIEYTLRKIQNNWGGRIVADLIAEGLATDMDDLKKKRADIAIYLTKVHLPWKALYDGVGGKLLLVPLDEIRFYASGMRGAHFMVKGG